MVRQKPRWIVTEAAKDGYNWFVGVKLPVDSY